MNFRKTKTKISKIRSTINPPRKKNKEDEERLSGELSSLSINGAGDAAAYTKP